MPKATFTMDQLRTRLASAVALLSEPCTPSDRADARLLINDTLRHLPPTDVVGVPFIAPAPAGEQLLERARLADGADLEREVL